MGDQNDVNVQDKTAEGTPESEVHTETKPAEDTSSSERTREQFEKLTKTNKEMAEKLSAYEAKERAKSVLDSLNPQPVEAGIPSFSLPQFNWQQPEPRLVDDQGFVDGNLLQLQLREAKAKAEKAEKDAQDIKKQFVNYEETQQTRLAHEKYPELDPNNEKFDKNFYHLVRNELIGQLASGKKDVIAAAEAVRTFYKPKAETPNQANTKDQTDEKQIINAGSTKASSKYSEAEDRDLAMATRKGAKGALAERLRRAGY